MVLLLLDFGGCVFVFGGLRFAEVVISRTPGPRATASRGWAAGREWIYNASRLDLEGADRREPWDANRATEQRPRIQDVERRR